MPTILLYVIKLSCSLALIWLFYRLVLRNLTFYGANRWYLLGYSLLCFLIPLINIGPIYREDPTLQPLIIQYIPVIEKPLPGDRLSFAGAPFWDSWNSLLVFLGVGVFLLLVRFVVRCLSLYRIRRKAVLLEQGPITIYQVNEQIVPFSWGNAVYINRRLHNDAEWAEIILHEYVHIRQRHYLDILVSEALTILNWYNPFAWLIRYSIRQNLEFIADRAVVEKGVDKKGYQYHLLKVVGQSSYRLANNFNFSSLKKRIIMMNKMRSARLHLLRFLFILPLAAVLLVAFRDRYDGLWRRSSGPVYANVAGIVFNFGTREPEAGVRVREKGSGVEAVTDARGYYKFAVPVKGDSFRIELAITKAGYQPGMEGAWGVSPKGSFGMVRATGLLDGIHRVGVFAEVPYTEKVSDDPGYADAMMVYQYEVKWNDDYKRFTDIQKAHPEVSLFYTAEGKQRQVVVRVDGGVEKYGYPGGPTVADMEKRYGVLPDFMKGGGNTAGSGYLTHWVAISAQAEKEFRPIVPVRAIVFPGDSRVIVVPVGGKPRFYDMDSDQPEERPAFEQTYGKLPDCVPPPYHYPASALGPAKPVKAVDTVPGGADTGRPVHEKLESLNKVDWTKVLWIVDGKEVAGFTKDSINPQDIAAIDIFKGEQAVDLFGSKGADGVVAVITKRYQSRMQDMNQRNGGAPLYIVNGKEAPANILQVLMASRIDSITVFKDSTAIARYGDKARNGVISIKLKKE